MLQQAPSTLSREQELDLLDSLLTGDEAAWRRFHTQYDRLIYRCIRKATHRFTSLVRREDEREIYCNLMVQLLSNDKRKLRRFSPSRGSRFSTWIGLLATNAAYDYLRSLRRELASVPLAEAETAHSETPSPFDQVERRERTNLMAELVATLSEKDRQFVTLYFNRGMSPETVADLMRISVKTVYSKKHKIRTRLEGLVAAERLAA